MDIVGFTAMSKEVAPDVVMAFLNELFTTFDALCDVYRAADYGRADFTIEQHVPMGADHAFAHLHWTLTRADGSLLQHFHTGYQLLRTAQGPKVLLAVAHEERLSEMTPHAAE